MKVLIAEPCLRSGTAARSPGAAAAGLEPSLWGPQP